MSQRREVKILSALSLLCFKSRITRHGGQATDNADSVIATALCAASLQRALGARLQSVSDWERAPVSRALVVLSRDDELLPC
jgi:hypothetical protein